MTLSTARSSASCRSSREGRPAHLRAVHRGHDARRRRARRQAPQRGGDARDDRRSRRGGHARGGGARDRRASISEVFEAIERERARSNVSVKPTAIGLGLSTTTSAARTWSGSSIEAAKNRNFVRIDMEDSSTTSDTLRFYRELRERGFDNVGVVLQAYLRRTLDDIRSLADLKPNVRLCKGIYIEPQSIAFTDYDAVRANFVRALDALLEEGAYVGVATHDEWLIGQALTRVGGMEPRRLRVPDAARRARASARASSSRTGIGCGSTCRSACSGTSTRSDVCRRIRRWPRRSRGRRWGACVGPHRS